MEEFKFNPENQDEVKKIYTHIERVINKINDLSFNKTFKLELSSTTFEGYAYLIPHFLIDDSFIELNYIEIGDFFMENYQDIIVVEADDFNNHYIVANLEASMNLESFRNTIDLDDKGFDLWFKFQYGT